MSFIDAYDNAVLWELANSQKRSSTTDEESDVKRQKTTLGDDAPLRQAYTQLNRKEFKFDDVASIISLIRYIATMKRDGDDTIHVKAFLATVFAKHTSKAANSWSALHGKLFPADVLALPDTHGYFAAAISVVLAGTNAINGKLVEHTARRLRVATTQCKSISDCITRLPALSPGNDDATNVDAPTLDRWRNEARSLSGVLVVVAQWTNREKYAEAAAMLDTQQYRANLRKLLEPPYNDVMQYAPWYPLAVQNATLTSATTCSGGGAKQKKKHLLKLKKMFEANAINTISMLLNSTAMNEADTSHAAYATSKSDKRSCETSRDVYEYIVVPVPDFSLKHVRDGDKTVTLHMCVNCVIYAEGGNIRREMTLRERLQYAVRLDETLVPWTVNTGSLAEIREQLENNKKAGHIVMAIRNRQHEHLDLETVTLAKWKLLF